MQYNLKNIISEYVFRFAYTCNWCHILHATRQQLSPVKLVSVHLQFDKNSGSNRHIFYLMK